MNPICFIYATHGGFTLGLTEDVTASLRNENYTIDLLDARSLNLHHFYKRCDTFVYFTSTFY